MSTTLFTPPPPGAPPRDPDRRDDEPVTPPPPPRRGSRPLATVVVAALIGGAASAGVLGVTGNLGGGSTATTTVVQPGATSNASNASDTSSTTLNPSALYASTAAGVVDITAKGTTTTSSQIGPFGGPQQQESTATGSGFVVDSSGHIVTAAHVVDGATSITVTFQDGTTRKATLLGKDDATDVAVLKIDPSGMTLHPLTLGSSASLDIGDAVAAIGDPFGYARSISTGIVSGLDRTISAPNGFTVAHAIQTDAALNPGNSGGPVLDSSGRVVGIVDQIATNGQAEQSSGVGFAVPIDLVASELTQLKAGQTVQHAYLGVSTSTASGTGGALVGQVVSGGPAAKAGLKAGDVITQVDGTKVTGSNELVAAINSHKPGEQLKLTIKRGSQTLTVTATLGTQPTQRSSN